MNSKIVLFAAAAAIGAPSIASAQAAELQQRANELTCQLYPDLCEEIVEQGDSTETQDSGDVRAALDPRKMLESGKAKSAPKANPPRRSTGSAQLTNRTTRVSTGARNTSYRRTGAVKVDNSVKEAAGANLFVTFKLGSAELTPAAKGEINSLVLALEAAEAAGKTGRLQIAGHTDSTGDDDRNMELSRERAASVRNALVEAGVAEDRLEAVGYGSTQPIEGYKTTNGINRRVVATVID